MGHEEGAGVADLLAWIKHHRSTDDFACQKEACLRARAPPVCGVHKPRAASQSTVKLTTRVAVGRFSKHSLNWTAFNINYTYVT